MGQRIDLSFQVQGILPAENGGVGSLVLLKFADNETPSGAVDGVNSTFTLATAPAPGGSLLLFFRPPAGQGILYFQSIDYTLSGGTINTTAPPTSGGNLRAWYRYSQAPLVLKDTLSLSDAVQLWFVPRLAFSESLSESDMFSFVLRPSAGLLVDRMIMQDSFAKQLFASKTFSDTMTLSDAFTKALV